MNDSNKNTSYIRCRDLTKVYQKGKITVTPLEDLDLDVRRGEFLALMGPSGSGKTTLLNLIAGIDRPTSGTLHIGGEEIGSFSRGQLTNWRAKHCGYVFQLYHLVPILSAYENVELPLLLDGTLSRRDRKEKVLAALDLVSLSDRADHRPTELSGGQEQRVAIARAIVADPGLIVADEPTGDLDRESGDQILELLRELSGIHQKTIVMVTHDARAAEAAERTLHLDKGRLVEKGLASTSTESVATS
ncbi:MAG: ABC transporter ATP-binding protein [Verrucomicrobiales bacterium]|nr:ABC transporter ATP-binding protein [Verrucomicrobiales bacterium]